MTQAGRHLRNRSVRSCGCKSRGCCRRDLPCRPCGRVFPPGNTLGQACAACHLRPRFLLQVLPHPDPGHRSGTRQFSSTRNCSRDVRRWQIRTAQCVITSYSIHYTKLYDFDRCRRQGTRSHSSYGLSMMKSMFRTHGWLLMSAALALLIVASGCTTTTSRQDIDQDAHTALARLYQHSPRNNFV